MKVTIHDQFVRWMAESFNDFITDLVTYPCAFLKGPVIRDKDVKYDQSSELLQLLQMRL